MQQKDNDQFSFINEKIKEKPVNKKRLLMQAGFIALMAVVFGIIASLVFAYFQPKFESLFYPEEEPVVTIPQDSVAVTELTEETETSEETEASEEPQAPSEEPPLQQPQELEIADVQNVQNKLYAVGREANRFVVTVTGVKSDTDWFNNSYESRGQASGIIIADSGQELLILTERKVISDAQEVYVTFINDVTVEASMKHYDGNTGIAVLSVPRSEVDEDTMNAISVAKLGNSLTTMQGTMVIAVGSPLGTNYSILTGNITSTNNVISTIDNNYTVFTTDIVGSSSGSGVIINVASDAAMVIVPGNAVYSGTKAYLKQFTEGLFLDLRCRGSHVTVQALCPGLTRTDFQLKMGMARERQRSRGMLRWQEPEAVVSRSLRWLARNRPVCLCGGAMGALEASLAACLPKRLYYRLILKLFPPRASSQSK